MRIRITREDKGDARVVALIETGVYGHGVPLVSFTTKDKVRAVIEKLVTDIRAHADTQPPLPSF